jgi:hypothetical protein
MYDLLVKLMLLAALAHFGMTLVDFSECHSLECVGRIEGAGREVLKIDWRPISVFPEEAKRFR